jgi:mannonate dehydratase
MNNRRDLLKVLTLLPLAACTRTVNSDLLAEQQAPRPTPAGWLPDGKELNLQPVKIKKVKAIKTAPYGIELVIVKVETDQPGLHGVGCATFRQRAHAVASAIDEYLDDFCRDKDVSNIEDLWQTAYVSSYWRNGPVLNNALSGLNQALWDIKGKMAGMPVYQLLGGKTRFAVDTYTHASGPTPEAVMEDVARYREHGFRHIRIQLGGYGATHLSRQPDYKQYGFGQPDDNTLDAQAYKRGVVRMFELARKRFGDELEFLHDIHERIEPMDAIDLIKKLEQFRPFFIEDPFSPENMGWFKMLRQQSAVPIAMGELFNNPHEWVEPISQRMYDFIRIHISQIGGITPAMKVARLAEWFNVRTAWHGPGDTSPIGHAANAHIDLAVWNFGIQEAVSFNELTREIFPGTPTMENGYMFVNEAPGLGIDIDEAKAEKYSLPHFNYNWTQVRKPDGTPVRP